MNHRANNVPPEVRAYLTRRRFVIRTAAMALPMAFALFWLDDQFVSFAGSFGSRMLAIGIAILPVSVGEYLITFHRDAVSRLFRLATSSDKR